MIKTGGFWAEEESPRQYCYKIVPKEIAHDSREMTLYGFERVYQALGILGYKFRDAGHNDKYVIKYVIISLDRKINQKHLKELENAFSIEQDSGTELGFA